MGLWLGPWRSLPAPHLAPRPLLLCRALVESRNQPAASSSSAASLGALVVVLAPTVVLTAQHAAYFLRAALPRTQVGAFSSDNPLSREAWTRVLHDTGRLAAGGGRGGGGGGGSHWVVVATAASFANLLQQRHAVMSQLDLLVRVAGGGGGV